MHILTRKNQFGYKEGISAFGAIIKVEQYIENANHEAKILLMGLSEAFGTINSTLLWTTLYKKGIPIDMIKRIRPGHQDTKLANKIQRNIWSAIRKQHRSISRIRHKRPTFHNLHGRHDGRQRSTEQTTKPPHSNCTRPTCAARKTTHLGHNSSRRQI